MKQLRLVFLSTLLGLSALLAAAPALAQMEPGSGPHGPYKANCGNWMNGIWVSNDRCANDPYNGRRGTVSGTITIVRGHLVTVQQSTGTVVIDDQPALNRQTTGRVAVGRRIVAHGFSRDGTFYATSIE